MSLQIEDIYREGVEWGEVRGLEKGRMETKKKHSLAMSELGIPVEQIAKVVGESVSQVQEWLGAGQAV